MNEHKIAIVPAVLPHTFNELEAGLALTAEFARAVQVDIVDGHYAKGKSWPYKDGDSFKKMAAEELGLPQWEHLDFEFDLMVRDPAAVVLDYVHAGASRLVVHAGAASAAQALEILVGLNEQADGAAVIIGGVALGSGEHPDTLLPFGDSFDFVQVMGIDHEGRQGEEFDPRALVLLERLRHRYPLLPLQVDGGVRLGNVRQLVAAGATRLVCGSAIFAADNPKVAYDALYTEANAQ